jgi:superfamily II DNA/RNA helicase
MPQSPRSPRTPSHRPRRPSSGRPAGNRNANGRSSGNRSRPAPAARPASGPAAELDRQLAAAFAAPPPAVRTFAELGLPAPIIAALTARGIEAPFPIQARTMPDALAGRDVLGRAETGSGKTLAFGLPMLARLASGVDTRRAGTPRGLVLVPTRELAQQVTDALVPLGQAMRVKVTAVYGGAPMGRQIDALKRGVDIVVATPGRLVDLIERRVCSLAQVEVAVLDEADYMADLGFLPAVTKLLDMTPAGGQRMLFSATLDRGVARLVDSYLTEPAVHAVASDSSPVEAMDHQLFKVRAEDKLTVTAEVASRPGRTLLFVRTKHGADRLAKQLQRAGVDAGAIHGNLNQNQRQRALDAFASGHARVLVATDVAARGIHVDDVDLVIHFDPPNDHKDYLHRSGRTARAGNAGTVLSLAQPEQVRALTRLHSDAQVTATMVAVHPGHEAVRLLATSGTPIVPDPRSAPRPVGRSNPRHHSSRRRPGAPRRAA